MELSVKLINVQILLFVVSRHVIYRRWLELSHNVRPIIEYCSVEWNTFFIIDITGMEKVQRRLRGMSKLTYHQRLVKVGLESLELRRICVDLVFAYEIIFGLTYVNTEDILTVMRRNSRRGHGYRLYMPCSKSTVRYNYFNHRVHTGR